MTPDDTDLFNTDGQTSGTKALLPVGRHADELPGVALVWAADAGGSRDILSLYL